MENRNLKLFVTVLIILFMIAVLVSSCASKSSLSYHNDLQKRLTFENAMKNNEMFTVKSYKSNLKSLEKELKAIGNTKPEKDQVKIEALKNKINQTKSKINEKSN